MCRLSKESAEGATDNGDDSETGSDDMTGAHPRSSSVRQSESDGCEDLTELLQNAESGSDDMDIEMGSVNADDAAEQPNRSQDVLGDLLEAEFAELCQRRTGERGSRRGRRRRGRMRRGWFRGS